MHTGGLVISASPSPVQLTPQRDYVCLCVPTPPAPVTEEAGPTGGRGKGSVDLAVLSELEDWWLLEHARQASLQWAVGTCTVVPGDSYLDPAYMCHQGEYGLGAMCIFPHALQERHMNIT